MTALGLAVAVPAVLGYNLLVRNNRVIIASFHAFAEDLLAYLTTGARVPSSMDHHRAHRPQEGGVTRPGDDHGIQRTRCRRRRTQFGPMAEINMIPLVDVMLVLLIIFMITAPLLAHKIKIDLPQASTVLLEEKPDTIVISLMADGKMFLNDVAIERTAMIERLAVEAQRKPQPELHLHVDRTLQFQALATVMADAQNAGMVKVGIATDPIKGAEGRGQ